MAHEVIKKEHSDDLYRISSIYVAKLVKLLLLVVIDVTVIFPMMYFMINLNQPYFMCYLAVLLSNISFATLGMLGGIIFTSMDNLKDAVLGFMVFQIMANYNYFNIVFEYALALKTSFRFLLKEEYSTIDWADENALYFGLEIWGEETKNELLTCMMNNLSDDHLGMKFHDAFEENYPNEDTYVFAAMAGQIGFHLLMGYVLMHLMY